MAIVHDGAAPGDAARYLETANAPA
jgi:hypothetical protein